MEQQNWAILTIRNRHLLHQQQFYRIGHQDQYFGQYGQSKISWTCTNTIDA